MNSTRASTCGCHSYRLHGICNGGIRNVVPTNLLIQMPQPTAQQLEEDKTASSYINILTISTVMSEGLFGYVVPLPNYRVIVLTFRL